jgi:hypothetical protein
VRIVVGVVVEKTPVTHLFAELFWVVVALQTQCTESILQGSRIVLAHNYGFNATEK